MSFLALRKGLILGIIRSRILLLRWTFLWLGMILVCKEKDFCQALETDALGRFSTPACYHWHLKLQSNWRKIRKQAKNIQKRSRDTKKKTKVAIKSQQTNKTDTRGVLSNAQTVMVPERTTRVYPAHPLAPSPTQETEEWMAKWVTNFLGFKSMFKVLFDCLMICVYFLGGFLRVFSGHWGRIKAS